MEATIEQILGPNSTDILWWQMLIRAITVFFIALIIVRLGGTRIFGQNTSFDIVLGFILGSILSRAITGNSPYFSTILSSAMLVFLHWILSWIALKHNKFGSIIKGNKTLLLKDGKYLKENMAKRQISENDFLEALRSKGSVEVEKVKYAYLERSGDISVII